MAKQRNASAKAPIGRRWTEVEARAVLASWRDSGQSLAEFSRSTGVDRQRIFRWHRRLESGGGGKVEANVATLVPVVVRGEGFLPSSAAVVVTAATGTRIEVREVSTATAAWVRSILDGEGRS